MVLNLLGAGVAGLAAYSSFSFYAPIKHTITVSGLLRKAQQSTVAPDDLVVIEDTVHCEDLHYYEPAETLFTACEDDPLRRFSWFPPLANFGLAPGGKDRASIHVVDPKVGFPCAYCDAQAVHRPNGFSLNA